MKNDLASGIAAAAAFLLLVFVLAMPYWLSAILAGGRSPAHDPEPVEDDPGRMP